MKTADFVVAKRPKLAAISRFPVVDIPDYERRLAQLQETLQRVQQAYLGTHGEIVAFDRSWYGRVLVERAEGFAAAADGAAPSRRSTSSSACSSPRGSSW